MADHVLPLHNLYALALEFFTSGALGCIQATPAFPGGDRYIAGLQQVDNRFRVALISCGELAGDVVLNEHGGGVLGIGLGVTNQADRTALDPTGGVQARDGFTGGRVDNMAAVVRDNGLLLIERHAVDVLWVVTNCTVNSLYWPVGELAGAGDIAVAVELGAFGANAHDLAVFADNLGRRFEEVDVNLVRCIAWLAHGVAFQCLADQVNGLGLAARSFRCGIVVDVLWRDNNLDGWRLVELLEFLRGVLCLRWAAAAKHVDFLGLVVLEGLVDVVWDFSNQQLIGGLRQDAGNVQRHVADADNGDGLSA